MRRVRGTGLRQSQGQGTYLAGSRTSHMWLVVCCHTFAILLLQKIRLLTSLTTMTEEEYKKFKEEGQHASCKDLTLRIKRFKTEVQELENENQMQAKKVEALKEENQVLAEKVKLLENENQMLKHKLVSENQMLKQKYEGMPDSCCAVCEVIFDDFWFDQETSNAHGAGTSSQHAHAHQV